MNKSLFIDTFKDLLTGAAVGAGIAILYFVMVFV